MLINVHFRSFWTFIKKSLFELNLFKNDSQDEFVIKNQYRSTRLFLFLLITSIFIIGFYYSVLTYTETVIIQSPSLIEYSTLSKKTSLECFCTKIAIKYEEFIEIKPYYHELCSSDFISDEYINNLYSLYEKTWNNSNSTDFHRIAVFQFMTLDKFCQLTHETIENNLEILLQTEFIQSQLISEESLQIQITSLLTNFIDLTPKTFLKTLLFIQNITAQNLFMTGASVTSVVPRPKLEGSSSKIVPYDGITYTYTDGSSCTCSSSTSNNCMGLTTYKNNIIIPGFQTGCYMLSALLKSTLEVFYNQTFINILTNTTDQFQKLNSSISNLTIEKLLSQMFITHWTNKTFFERYFNQCSPDYCQYTTIKHNDLLFIITSLIGLLGGLSSSLKFIAPFIINKIWPIISKFRNKRRTFPTHNDNIQINRVSLIDRIKNLFQFLKQKLIELNLFESKPPSEDENILQQQRFITKIYFILLLLSIIIIIIFTSIAPSTIHFIIKSPSFKDFIQLNNKYSLTLNCPCSNTAIDYLFITNIKPQYHEICLSDFILSNWINIQFNKYSSIKLYTVDIRYQLEFYFQLLSTLCQMSNQTIEDSLQSFYQTKFISNEILNPESFEIKINLIIEHFKKTIPESFQRTLNLLKTNFEINQFITPMNTLFDYHDPEIYGIYLRELTYRWQKPNECSTNFGDRNSKCLCYPTTLTECYENITININGTNDIIPGMFQTFFPLQSILMSTLECFYNDTCLSNIKKLINSNISSSSSLLISNNKYYKINLLANNLFIQSWINQSSFESYFNQCYPLTCQYTIQTRLNFIYIITSIIGLIGGINLALHIMLPFIIKWIAKIFNYILQLKRNNFIRIEKRISMRRRSYTNLQTLFISIKQALIELNIFSKMSPLQDSKIIHRYRRLTRIYLILLVISLFILIIYGLLRQETNTVIIKSPSISKYKQLFDQYPLTLKCPCSNIAIKYNKFISQNQPQYHQVCSSIFVSSEWLDSMERITDAFGDWYSLYPDYRNFIRIQFQTLSQLCTLSQKTLNTSLSIFEQNDFITLNLISYTEFNIRTETILEQFKSSVSKQFIETLKLIQLMNHGNQLATLFSSNWIFTSKYPINDINRAVDQSIYVLTQPETYGIEKCSCGIQSNCSTLSHVTFISYVAGINPVMPGFHIGCFVFDSFLQSSLTCLYNKTCLGFMQAYTYYSKPIKANVLDYSPLSVPNTTIETILNNLFVIKWFQKTSFDLYFNECSPQSCQYSYTIQYNTAYVITMLIAVFGGLTEGLYYVLYYFELILMKLINDRKKKNSIKSYPQRLDIATINRNNNVIEDISNSPTSTFELNVISVEQQNQSRNKYIDRAILIGLILLIIIGIVTTSLILLFNQNKEEKFMSTSTQTTLISTTSNPIKEITDTCYMTLKYQSQSYTTDSNPVSMITGDFNQDSIIDLAVTNFYSDTLSIMLGNGDGTFQMQQTYSTGNGSRPQEIRTADFNNDGFLDLVVTLSVIKKIVIFFGVSTNNLFVLPPYNCPFYTYDAIPNVIEVADMNKDGFIDLIVGFYSNTSSYTDKLLIFLNQGDGYQFRRAYSNILWSNTNIFSIVISDFHHDGINQLSLISDDSFVRIYSAVQTNLPSQYTSGGVYNLYGYPSMMIKGRFNNDSIDDLALISSQSDTLSILMSMSFFLTVRQIYFTERYPTSIVPINFNNDSIDDIAILSCDGTLSVFLGQNIGLFDQNYLSFKLNRTNNNNDKCCQSLRIADLNQDGKDDLVFIDTDMNSVRVVLGSPCNE